MNGYGYLHLGRILSYNEESGGYFLESVGLARASKWGPVVSCVPGLLVNDRVVLAAAGTTRDDLKIIAKVGATFPDIGDIPGLIATLAAKADDTEITTINGTLASHTSSLAAHAAELVVQDGRLDADDIVLAAHAADLVDIKRYGHGFATPDEYKLYGGKLSSVPRYVANGTVVVDNTTRTRVLIMGIGNPGETFTGIRFNVTGAVAATTANYGVFWGTSVTSMAQQATGSFSVAATGEISATFSSPIVVPSTGVYYIAAMLCSPTGTPSYGTLGVPSGLGQGSTGIRMIGFDAGTSVPAGPINLSTAGSYSASSSRFWVELF